MTNDVRKSAKTPVAAQSVRGGPIHFDLNLKQLKAFYYVALHLNFTRAAEELFITQPAVTAQISALERQYGLSLFSRKKNEVSLTDAGTILFSYTEKVMEAGFEAEQALCNLKANPHGLLRLGTTRAIARFLLSPYILKFQAAFPQVTIKVSEGSSEEMAASVLYERNDVAIVGRISYDEKVEAHPLPGHETDQILVMVPPGHRFATRDEVTFAEVAGEPLILREEGSGARHLIREAFQERRLKPTILLEASNLDFIRDLLLRGAGVAILAKMSLQKELEEGILRGIPLAEGGKAIHVDVVVLKEGYRSPVVAAFLDAILKSDASGVAGGMPGT